MWRPGSIALEPADGEVNHHSKIARSSKFLLDAIPAPYPLSKHVEQYTRVLPRGLFDRSRSITVYA